MGSLSVSTCRGLLHWQGLLLIVSLLNVWCLPTTAEFAIVSTNVVQGEDAYLYLRNTPPDVTCFRWYKGAGEQFRELIATHYPPKAEYVRHPLYNTAERIVHKEYLVLKEVTRSDGGMYTVVAHLPDSKKKVGFGRLNVFDREMLAEIAKNSEEVKQCMRGLLAQCLL